MATSFFEQEELRDLYVRQKLSIHAIARQKRCHHSTVWRYLVLHGIPRRSVSEAKIKYPRNSFSGELTEKAYLLGFRAGDLHVHRANHSETSETITVACVSTMTDQIELVRSLFSQYGRVNISEGPKQTSITCYLDLSFNFLLDKDDKVPHWIMADQKCFAAFLAGYIDAEGCIQVKAQTHAAEVTIRSYDVNILRTCWAALKRLGITCPPVHLIKSAGERDATGPIYHKDYWCLGIYRKQSLSSLFAIIDPYLKHPKRRQDMLKAWENVRMRSGHMKG
jgi:hypothetical protein